MTGTNGRSFLAFEAYDTPQWFAAVDWLTSHGFSRNAELAGALPIVGLDEGVMPSFVAGEITIAAGLDNWSGNYLVASFERGDGILAGIAKHIAAEDRRSAA